MSAKIQRAIALCLTLFILLVLAPFGLVAEDGDTTNEITISFVVDNPVYTHDPGSGYTHLTSPTAYTGGALTYTSWAGRYQVTGTGLLYAHTIPAGTSLADNGFALPNLNVENITNSNTHSFYSMRTWIDENAVARDADTVFTEDTTLRLRLFEEEWYTLDFICCDEHAASVGYYCGGGVPSFLLGDSISEQYIYTYEDIIRSFPNTNHDTTHFAGWQLKNTATGEYVPFGAGVPITADYVNEAEYGDSIKVYAVWQEPAVSVTASFYRGAELIDTLSLHAGDALGILPDLSSQATEGEVFLGWQYQENGMWIPATAETVITQDTTYTAVFVQESGQEIPEQPTGYYNLTLHDILPDGTEAEPTITLSVAEGTLWADIEDTFLVEDGAAFTDCRWYTLVDGEKTLVDLSEFTVTEDTALYTYSYRVTLHLLPQTLGRAAVEITPGQNGAMTMTITAREGEPLTAADFVVGGVDYSLYTWTYVDSQGHTQTLSISNLIANGLTETIEATSSGALAPANITPHSDHNVNYYVFINGERQLVKSEVTTCYTFESGSNARHYLSAATLEAVYAPYGFSASSMTVGTRYFPHVDVGGATIWADTAVRNVNGYFFSPVTTHHKNAVDVYYLPKQTLGSTYADWANYQTTDTFYSVTVRDVTGAVYGAADLPAPVYVLNGGSTTVSVSNEPLSGTDAITWSCIGADDSATIAGSVVGNTTSFTISGIGQPYIISPQVIDTRKQITYDINRPKTPMDPEYGKPQIEGEDIHIVYEDNTVTEHTVLAPSLTSYFYLQGKKYLGEATFLGWAVNGDTDPEDLIQPDATLSLAEYGNNISLQAQWRTEHADNIEMRTGPMVNFFVSLAAHPEGDSVEWQGFIEESKFTDSVFTDNCGVEAGLVPSKRLYENSYPAGGGTQYFVLGSTSGANINDNHNLIVNSLSAGYTKRGNDNVDYTFQLSFPTDEQVLRRIRQMMQEGTEIEINHHTVSVDEMTAENYSVRWYVFKYDTSDGWHIDGVLVSRQGTMVVTKTFAGAQDAINAVKQNYSISVTAQAGATHTGGILHLNDAGVLYDEATNTYRWEVPVDRYYNYTVTENNYLLSGELYATTAQYMVQNSKTANQNTTGWQTYTTSGVTVTGQSHHEDDPQKLTVSFLNTYTPPGELVVRKIDKYTGHGMAGITFTVKDANDNALPLIDNGNSHYALAADSGTGYTVTSEIVTDHNGQIYLTLPEGTYKLEEVLPAGYDNPGIITVVLAMDTSTNEVVLQSADSSGGDKYVTTHGDQLEITANNYAKEFSLTVHKNWLDPDTKPVTLRLLQNGVPLRDPVTLDGTVDAIETRPWEATFTNLRLYIDGQVANYTLREERIGEFAYSTEYPGGYRYYNVNYAPIVYYDADGAVTEDPVEAVTANLSVSNSRNTVTDVTITKEITGALADFDKVFHFVVDAQSPMADGEGYILSSNKKQATFTLGHGDSVTLRNVKIGETLVITETAEGYTMRMLVDSATVTNPVTITEDMTVVVRNSKDHVPDAGIWLDKWPYLLIIGGAAAAAIVLIVRKRRKKDDD